MTIVLTWSLLPDIAPMTTLIVALDCELLSKDTMAVEHTTDIKDKAPKESDETVTWAE